MKEEYEMKPKIETSLYQTIILLERFIEKKLNGATFQSKYIKLWKTQRDKGIEFYINKEKILNTLFLDIDAFVADKNLLKGLIKENSQYTKNNSLYCILMRKN